MHLKAPKLKIIAAVATCLLATACNAGCDLTTCPDKLDILLDKPVSSTYYKLEVLIDGVSLDSRTIQCEQGEACGLKPVRLGPSPSDKPLSIRVTTAEGAKVTEYDKISWALQEVDNCHTCRSATVTALAP